MFDIRYMRAVIVMLPQAENEEAWRGAIKSLLLHAISNRPDARYDNPEFVALIAEAEAALSSSYGGPQHRRRELFRDHREAHFIEAMGATSVPEAARILHQYAGMNMANARKRAAILNRRMNIGLRAGTPYAKLPSKPE